MRYAIYFTPAPGTGLRALGTSWLGRDAVLDEAVQRPDGRLDSVTVHPTRYGFHSTLKAPFHLKPGTSLTALENATLRLASQHHTIYAGILEVTVMDGFLALVPAQHSIALDALAADCVKQLDDFRRPAEETELQRRRAVGLSAAEEANLMRWGYPFVLDHFHFHMTLTDRLSQHQKTWVEPLARSHFATVLGKPLIIDALTIATEASPGAAFTEHMRLPLVSTSQRAA